MLKQSDSFLKSMKVIMRTRLFRQAWIRVFAFLPLIVNIPLIHAHVQHSCVNY
ncbi:unnamed protein product [Ectocarpus sp. 8 AP-2014]